VAAAEKRVGACRWPQFIDRDGCWREGEDASVCWVITDAARWCAQFLRLDGAQFTRRDGKSIKAWTKGSPKWPIGAGEMGGKDGVLLVEGGADLLAAYHFLHAFGTLDRVAVVALLGASMKIAEDALPLFSGKWVRIMLDSDEAGLIAMERWEAQLAEAGARVESFGLPGAVRADNGAAVKDLNDLAYCAEDVWLDRGLRKAFVDFWF
jgi:hypothetical protein